MNLNELELNAVKMSAEYAVANFKEIQNDLNKIKKAFDSFRTKYNYFPSITRYSHCEEEDKDARVYKGYVINVSVEKGEQGWTGIGSKIMQDEDFPEHNR